MMNLAAFAALCVLCGIGSTEAKTGYAVFAPSHVVPGSEYVVNVLLTREATDTAVTQVTVSASFDVPEMGRHVAKAVFSGKNLGANAEFRVAVPQSLKTRNAPFNLVVNGTGHIQFVKVLTISVQSAQGYIYLQMDKPIYRAGDKMRFVAFGLYNDFLPIANVPMNITLMDNNKNIVQSWLNVMNVTSYGVLQFEVQLSSKAPLGMWQMYLTYGNSIYGEHYFPVENYELAYFEATIQSNLTYLARYETNNAILITTDGKYQALGCSTQATCDKVQRGQVYGSAELDIWLLGPGDKNLGKITSKQLVAPGISLNYAITTDQINRVTHVSNVERLLITSTITESETMQVSSANISIPLIDYRYLLELEDGKDKLTFRAGDAFNIQVMVLKINGSFTEADAQKFELESAASCDLKAIENKDDLWDLPESATVPVRLHGAVIKIDSTAAGLQCDTIYVRAILRLRRSTSKIDSITIPVSRFIADAANFLVKWEDEGIVKNYIQTRIGDYISFEINSDQKVAALQWMVVSRGQVFETGFETRQTIMSGVGYFTVERHHMPRSTIIAWTMRNDELIADTLEFEVVDNSISIEYSTSAPSRPHNFGQGAIADVNSPLTFRYNTSVNSYVQLLAIDEKVMMHLNSRLSSSAANSIGGTKYSGEFVPASDQKLQENFLDVALTMKDHLASLAGPLSNSVLNTYEVFKQSQILIETTYTNTKGMPRGRNAIAISRNSPTSDNFVRVIFPEVFLFESLFASSNSIATTHTTPDSITTWYVTAFSLNPFGGLAFANVLKVPVYREFYMSVYIPTLTYKCNETVSATVYVFNPRPFDVTATAYLEGMPTYKVDGQRTNFTQKNTIVRALSSSIIKFDVQFTEVGLHEINVYAVTADGRKDAVRTQVHVKPEGIAKKKSFEPVFCPDEKVCSRNVVLEPQREGCDAVTTGESSITITPMFVTTPDYDDADVPNNLPDPGGCCEQRMRGIIENTGLLRTLRRNGPASPNTEAIATSNLRIMLQSYLGACTRLNDGAVSPFYPSNSAPSGLLTAFIARTLTVAGELLPDSGATQQAEKNKKWLLTTQKSDGSFSAFPSVAPHEVITFWYAFLETGGYEHATSTAYALIGLLEHPTSGPQYAKTYTSQLLKASKYLQDAYKRTDNTHYLAITAYALQLAGMRLNDGAEKIAASIVETLKARQVSADGKTFWPYYRTEAEAIETLRSIRNAVPIEVETASFMLEIYFQQAKKSEASSVYRFLLSQRDSNHRLPRGTYSSHASGLGQLAIGDFALLADVKVAYSGPIKIVSTRGTKFTTEIEVKESMMTPIQIDLPAGVQEVLITSGAKMTQVYIETYYYYQNPYHAYTDIHSGVIDTQVFAAPTSPHGNFAALQVCNSWKLPKPSGMITSLIELQSGYDLHSSLQDIQRQHLTAGNVSMVASLERIDDKNFAVYYNYLPSYQSVCTEFLLRRSINVRTLATAAVRTYDYYYSTYTGFQSYKISVQDQPPRAHETARDEL